MTLPTALPHDSPLTTTAHVAGEAAFFLAVDQPLDLAATLESGQVFRWERDADGFRGVIGRDAYHICQRRGGPSTQLMATGLCPAHPELRQESRVLGPVEGHERDTHSQLSTATYLAVRSTAAEARAREMLRRFLRLDDDLEGIYEGLAGDPHLDEAIARYRGLRIVRSDPWECLATFVCSQVSNIPRINGNLRTLAQTLGDPVTLDGRVLHAFPSPERVAEAGEAGLRALGWGFRGAYMARIAEAVADGSLDMAALRDAPYAEAKAALMALPGIGEKVADCVLVFSLEKLEGFPLDRWVRRAVAEWYGHPERVKYADVLAWAQARWGTRAGYVQQYLFHARRLMG